MMKNSVAGLKNYALENWWRIFIAVILLLTELTLMLRSGGWLRTETDFFLRGGEEMWMEQMDANGTITQTIVPRYDTLDKIGLYFSEQYGEAGDGSVEVSIQDEDGDKIYSETMNFSKLTYEQYLYWNVDLTVRTNQKYFIVIAFSAQDGETVPAVGMCPSGYGMSENEQVIKDGAETEGQLLTWYYYSNALLTENVWLFIVLAFLTALGIGVKLPKNKWFRGILTVILLAVGPVVLGRWLELLTLRTDLALPMAMIWNIGLMYGVEFVILGISWSPRFAVILSNVFFTILYSANYYVYKFRGNPLRISEFKAAGTAADVVGGYDLSPNNDLALCWVMLLCIIVYAIALGRQKMHFEHAGAVHALSAVLSAAMALTGGYILMRTDFLEQRGFNLSHGFDRDVTWNFNGYLVSLCIDFNESQIEMPDGYSEQVAEDLLETYCTVSAAERTEDLPHVILIMNESWSDLRVLGNLQLSSDNMEFVNSLQENTIHGYVNASVLGGGTANSEFEVLTGCTMGFLPNGSYAYLNYVNEPMNTMVSMMKDNGYMTYSIHPAAASNWNREGIYTYFGFDESFWVDDFQGNWSGISTYSVTDLESYQKIEELYENREEGEKLFVFDVTVFNHGGDIARQRWKQP